MKITKEQIRKIAEELDSGFNVYINRNTGEIRSILDIDSMYGDTESWEEELERLENEWDDYLVITKMESREAYKVMEAFVDEVDDERLQEDLIKILNRRSPFANFKAEIDESDYRQKWFAFKQMKYEEYVRDSLEANEIEFES